MLETSGKRGEMVVVGKKEREQTFEAVRKKHNKFGFFGVLLGGCVCVYLRHQIDYLFIYFGKGV